MHSMVVINWIAYGERVLTARRRCKLTQTELAQQIGISRNTLSEIERGVAVPSYAIVMSLCAALDVVGPPYHTPDEQPSHRPRATTGG